MWQTKMTARASLAHSSFTARCRSALIGCAVFGLIALPGLCGLNRFPWVKDHLFAADQSAAPSKASDDQAAKGGKTPADAIPALLARRCLDCHNASDNKGGLDLTTRQSALKGGDTGPAIIAGQAADSLLMERVLADEMPPKHPLPEAERKLLQEWIAAGAKWSTDPIDRFRYSSEARAGYDFWSLLPVQAVVPPQVQQQRWVRNPIDQFVLHQLEREGITPAQEADRRTLIRRLTFDLLGLPPEPEEVEQFVNDPAADAYERLVDRLLDSPHYGERWARHWLDVVRYGESQGFERDRHRPNAWPYRDWVIDAFNRDLPYGEFIRQQIAGDLFSPGDPQAAAATGFLVCAPYDEVGQTQQSAAMRAVVRQDEIEDLVGVTLQTFAGLTANCARCHDHKFDPISQQDYYRLAASLGGARHGERDRQLDPMNPQITKRYEALQAAEEQARTAFEAFVKPLRERWNAQQKQSEPVIVPPEPIARWDFDGQMQDRIGNLHGTGQGGARIENGQLIVNGTDGYVATAPIAQPIEAKTLEAWVQLDRLDQRGGGVISLQTLDGQRFDAIVFGELEPGKWMAGSNGFERTQSFQGPGEQDAATRPVHLVQVYTADRQIQLYRDGSPYGQPYTAGQLVRFAAGEAQIVFGLRHSPPGGNRMLAGRIDRAALYDRALTAAEVAALAGKAAAGPTEDQLVASLTQEERRDWNRLLLAKSRATMQRQLMSPGKAYAVVPATPEPTYLLDRGNPGKLKDRMAPGAIAAVHGPAIEFTLPPDAPDADRRKKLAEWMSDPQHPLAARVMMNRLWQAHFGAGLIETPNDFGFNGTRPSHPELLDWLAGQMTASGGRLKAMQKLIVTSATYRQASQGDPRGLQKDAGNRWLWRHTPQRLEAESVRDAMLAVSGTLNPAMGGPGFQDFKTFNFNSQFYELYDPPGYAFQRRTIYRTWLRSARSELLDVFDCPDPSTMAPRRPVTTTPAQALALLNGSFALRMADRMAERLNQDCRSEPQRKTERLYRLLFGRAPSEAERQRVERFAEQNGWPALCRVLFNSNEFLYVD